MVKAYFKKKQTLRRSWGTWQIRQGLMVFQREGGRRSLFIKGGGGWRGQKIPGWGGQGGGRQGTNAGVDRRAKI